MSATTGSSGTTGSAGSLGLPVGRGSCGESENLSIDMGLDFCDFGVEGGNVELRHADARRGRRINIISISYFLFELF